MSAKDVIGSLCGFLTVIGGIFLLNAFRDMPISWRDVSSATRKSINGGQSANGNETHQLLENNSDDREFGESAGLTGRGGV